jgi:hypothetical protein
MNKKDCENDDGEKENEEIMKEGGDLKVGGEIEIEEDNEYGRRKERRRRNPTHNVIYTA